jgi:hypothetical protein
MGGHNSGPSMRHCQSLLQEGPRDPMHRGHLIRLDADPRLDPDADASVIDNASATLSAPVSEVQVERAQTEVRP